MTDTTQIIFKEVDHSDLVKERIYKRVHKLEQIFDRITSDLPLRISSSLN